MAVVNSPDIATVKLLVLYNQAIISKTSVFCEFAPGAPGAAGGLYKSPILVLIKETISCNVRGFLFEVVFIAFLKFWVVWEKFIKKVFAVLICKHNKLLTITNNFNIFAYFTFEAKDGSSGISVKKVLATSSNSW